MNHKYEQDHSHFQASVALGEGRGKGKIFMFSSLLLLVASSRSISYISFIRINLLFFSMHSLGLCIKSPNPSKWIRYLFLA